MTEFVIGKLKAGDAHAPLIISDIGINHGGDIEVAIAIADQAIAAGAQIIKHQTHIPDDEMSIEARDVVPGNSTRSIYDIIASCALNENDEHRLKKYIESQGAVFISTPFGRAAVERLVEFDVPAFKVGSGECNNYPLLKCIAKHGKPVILSTGMNSLDSVEKAVSILSENCSVAIMHCTNLYPTPPHLTRLGGIADLKEAFPNNVIGYSDHSVNIYPCVGAVALGANIIERHFTDTYEREGEDICCSMDPGQLADLIVGSKEAWLARGGHRESCEEEGVTAAFAFASVVSICEIESGDILDESNIWVKRPAGGDFTANDYENLFGKTANRFIGANRQIKASDIC